MHLAYFSIKWICCSQHRTPGIQTGVYASLGNGNAALLHDLMYSSTIDISHFVKLVDADHAPIGQDHGARLQPPFSRLLIGGHSCRQAHALNINTHNMIVKSQRLILKKLWAKNCNIVSNKESRPGESATIQIGEQRRDFYQIIKFVCVIIYLIVSVRLKKKTT